MTRQTEREDCAKAIAGLEEALAECRRSYADKPRRTAAADRLARVEGQARAAMMGAREVMAQGGHVPSETSALQRARESAERLTDALKDPRTVCKSPAHRRGWEARQPMSADDGRISPSAEIVAASGHASRAESTRSNIMTDTALSGFDDELLARKLIEFVTARRQAAARLGPLIGPLLARIRGALKDDALASMSDGEVVSALMDALLATGALASLPPLPAALNGRASDTQSDAMLA